MIDFDFDRPAPDLTEPADSQTLAAIAEGIAQIEAGEAIPIQELRKEFVKRCPK